MSIGVPPSTVTRIASNSSSGGMCRPSPAHRRCASSPTAKNVGGSTWSFSDHHPAEQEHRRAWLDGALRRRLTFGSGPDNEDLAFAPGREAALTDPRRVGSPRPEVRAAVSSPRRSAAPRFKPPSRLAAGTSFPSPGAAAGATGFATRLTATAIASNPGPSDNAHGTPPVGDGLVSPARRSELQAATSERGPVLLLSMKNRASGRRRVGRAVAAPRQSLLMPGNRELRHR